MNCFHSFKTNNKFQSHKKVCENKDFCNVIIPCEGTKILLFNQNRNSDKAPFIIYADLQCIIEKIGRCSNNPEYLSANKVRKYILSAFLMHTISSFRRTGSKHDLYRGRDCIKKPCESLREHAMKIINF